MAVLKKIAGNRLESMTIRIPAELAQEIAQVKEVAKAAGMEFPVGEICREALTDAVRAARKELARSAAPAEPVGEAGAAN